jgi:flagellin-like hook-associated protein FlgL
LSNIATRIAELATQAANDIYTSSQRSALDAEAQALGDEFTRIMSSTTFNGRTLLDGTFSQVSIQVGPSPTDSIAISVSAIGSTTTGANGTFQSAVSFGAFSVSHTLQEVTAIYADGDTNLDLVYADNSSPRIWVQIGNGNGTFKTAISYDSYGASSISSTTEADVDGDGDIDVVTNHGSALAVMRNNGSGVYSYSIADLLLLGASSSSPGSDYIDINNDGAKDLVTHSDASTVVFFLGNGNGTFKARQSFAASSLGYIQQGTDLNADGNQDLVFGASTGGNFIVILGNGNGTFKTPVSYTLVSAGGYYAEVTDVSGDGVPDILSQGVGLGVAIGNGDGTFKLGVTYGSLSGSAINAADINSDGNVDVLATGFGTTGLYAFLGNGNGTFKAPYTFGSNTGTVDHDLADVNNDGVLDLLITQQPTTDPLQVMLGNSGSVTSSGLGTFSLLTQAGGLAAITTMSSTQTSIDSVRGEIGAYLSRFEHSLHYLAVIRENYTSAYSRVVDADIASEVAESVRL